ncbi:hypothetical protein M3J09_009167 [Ascochyta lentis]
MPNQSRLLRCKYCNDEFQRNGHLQRHLLRHSGVKPFSCKVCPKSFSRKDTLLRHEITHGRQESRLRKDRRLTKACFPCADAKQRCYGGDPCARCEQKGTFCESGSEQRQSSVLSVSPTNTSPKSGDLSEIVAEKDATVSLPSLPMDSESAPTPTETQLQALITMQSKDSSVAASSSDSLSEGASGTSWSSLPLPDFISTGECDLYEDHLPHDMRCAVAMTPNSGFPFTWTMQSIQGPSQVSYTAGQDITDLSLPDNDDLAALGTIGDVRFSTSGLGSGAIVGNGEPGTCDNLGETHVPPAGICPSFPVLQEEQLQNVGAEVFGYVSKISEIAYTALCSFYVSERGYDDMSFPHSRLLHSFVELYFEYFDPQLPFLHPTRVGADDLPWILLTAVAAIGSQYSEVRDAFRFTTVLQYLLRKATLAEDLHDAARQSQTALVQSVLLRDVGMTFSGSTLDQTVLQQEKTMLITLCRRLSIPSGFSDSGELIIDHDLDGRWLSWLRGEEVVRLVHCVYLMECFQLVFFDLRPVLRLTDFTQRLPCNGNTWRCRNARQWSEEMNKVYPDGQTQQGGIFSTRSTILSLYADERVILDHMQSSRRLKSLIRSKPGIHLQDPDTYSARKKLLSFGASQDDIAFLDALIDDAVVNKSATYPESECSGQDPIPHIIAILREIPLRMIYASVGWQANDAEMQRSRERLIGYLQHNESTARKCLWHSAQIYACTRSLRYPAYYSSLSFAMAATYILLYDQLIQCPTSQGDLLRIDKTMNTSSIDAWTKGGSDLQVHIKGVGILNGGESSLRVLVDAERALRCQRPWRSLAQAIAHCLLQMNKGQKPKVG